MFEEVIVLEKKYNELMEQLTLPEIFNDFVKYSKISKEASKLAPTIETYHKYQKLVKDIATAQEITDPELAELAQEEIAENQAGREEAALPGGQHEGSRGRYGCCLIQLSKHLI